MRSVFIKIVLEDLLFRDSTALPRIGNRNILIQIRKNTILADLNLKFETLAPDMLYSAENLAKKQSDMHYLHVLSFSFRLEILFVGLGVVFLAECKMVCRSKWR